MHDVSCGNSLLEMLNPILWEQETICLKCQILFSGKSKKHHLSSAESAHSLLSVKYILHV